MRKRAIALRVLAAAAVGVLAPSVLPAAPAQATLSGCWDRQLSDGTGWVGGCGGTNQPGYDKYRAVAYCIREDGNRRTAYGEWVDRIPYWNSTAVCPVNYYAYNGTLEKKEPRG